MAEDENDNKVQISCNNCDVSYWVKWSDEDAETSIEEEDAIFENEEEQDDWN